MIILLSGRCLQRLNILIDFQVAKNVRVIPRAAFPSNISEPEVEIKKCTIVILVSDSCAALNILSSSSDKDVDHSRLAKSRPNRSAPLAELRSVEMRFLIKQRLRKNTLPETLNILSRSSDKDVDHSRLAKSRPNRSGPLAELRSVEMRFLIKQRLRKNTLPEKLNILSDFVTAKSMVIYKGEIPVQSLRAGSTIRILAMLF